MNSTSVLLLDLGQSGNLGTILRGILESSSFLKVHFLRDSAKLWRAPHFEDSLVRIVSLLDPDFILLVTPPSFLKQSDEVLKCMGSQTANLPIMAFVDIPDSSNTMALMLKSGVIELIPGPLTPEGVLPLVWKLVALDTREDALTGASEKDISSRQLIGKSATFLEQVRKIPLIAKWYSCVLISGESGTGKEVFARKIHSLSLRGDGPFVPIDCGAVPVDLHENELFGYEVRAFNEVASAKPGLIQEAEGGMLFLDKVDCLSPVAQVKLLHLLQEKKYRPPGSAKEIDADVRVIAALDIDTEEAVRTGGLRRDLYYRLNAISLKLPPLRDRREDIPLLAYHFLTKYAAEFSKEVIDFSPSALWKFAFYDWPGNVRELEHVVEGAVALSEGKVVQDTDITLPQLETTGQEESFREAKEKFVQEFERAYIESSCSHTRAIFRGRLRLLKKTGGPFGN